MNPIQSLLQTIRARFTVVRENDSTLMIGAFSTQDVQHRDRFPYDRYETLLEVLDAWLYKSSPQLFHSLSTPPSPSQPPAKSNP